MVNQWGELSCWSRLDIYTRYVAHNEQLNEPWVRLYAYMAETTQRNWRRQRGRRG